MMLQAAWSTVKMMTAIQAYERLLKEYPKAPEAKEADTRLKELKKDSESH